MSIVYRGRVFSVSVETLRLPNGTEHQIDVVRHPPSVLLVPMPDPEHVILIRQYRHPAGMPLWELPAGSLDQGETAEAGARRECEEEISLVPARLERLGSWYPSPGFCDEEMVFFRATGLAAPAPDSPHRPDEDEVIEARVFTIVEAKAMLARGDIVDLKTAFGLTMI